MDVLGRCLAVLAGFLTAFTAGASAAEARPEPAQRVQRVALVPASGPVGATVAVGGQLAATCASASSVTVEWDGTEIATALTFAVPADAVGTHGVRVSCIV